MRWAGIALLAACMPAFAADNARQLLDAMSDALASLSYDGTFVYLHDGHLDAMRIIHRMDNAGPRERLVSLTGSAREVVRDDRTVTCILPDNKSVMVGKTGPVQPFPSLPKDLERITRNYRIEDLGDERMTGRMAHVIAIIPRDDYRYGYRFWIDSDSDLPLKSDLTGAKGRPIEQLMFTRLAIGDNIPENELQPGMSGEGYEWSNQMSTGTLPRPTAGDPGWKVGRLPDGFTMTHYRLKPMHKGHGDARHMVFSDGLATVSVYIEDADKVMSPLSGLSGMGAMNAFGTVIDGFQVTVVGEVPPATVEMIAGSLTRSGSHD